MALVFSVSGASGHYVEDTIIHDLKPSHTGLHLSQYVSRDTFGWGNSAGRPGGGCLTSPHHKSLRETAPGVDRKLKCARYWAQDCF